MAIDIFLLLCNNSNPQNFFWKREVDNGIHYYSGPIIYTGCHNKRPI